MVIIIQIFIKLNSVCEFAICLDISVGSKRVTIIVIGLFKININNKVPITLKHKCIKAALLAFLFVPILDNKDVSTTTYIISI